MKNNKKLNRKRNISIITIMVLIATYAFYSIALMEFKESTILSYMSPIATQLYYLFGMPGLWIGILIQDAIVAGVCNKVLIKEKNAG